MIKSFIVLLLVVALVCASLPFKNVQGPPEEFDMHKLPAPVVETSDGATFPVFLRKTEGSAEASWTGDVPVDSESLFTLTLIAKDVKTLQLEVVAVIDTSSTAVNANDLPLPTDVHTGFFGFNAESSVPSKTFEFKKPTRGTWTIKVTDSSAQTPNSSPSLFLATFNQSPDRVSSHLASSMTHAGNDFTVVASLIHTNAEGSRVRQPNEFAAPLMVDLDIITPKGEEFIVTMHDDGNHGDNAPNDGVYAASFSAADAGSYTAQVVMRGHIGGQNGVVSFLRTSQHLVAVVDKSLELAKEGALFAADANDEMAEIKIPANVVGDITQVVGKKYKAYAEVWTTDAKQAIAFVTGMTIAEKVTEKSVALPLKLNMKWLNRAKADVSIILRNVYVQDVATSVPLSTADEIKTQTSYIHRGLTYNANSANALLRVHLVSNPLYKFTSLDDESMHFGKRPEHLKKTNANGNHKVILVHGYCSSGNPFSSEDFTDFMVFEDKKANRDHDTFATMIGEFGKNLDSFALVGHSQGGPASLHLLTFYWSKQDVAQTPAGYKHIQTVGSPWRGSGLAGSLASIGSSLGFGCGKNTDLTHDGADRWLATIPAKTRSYVSFYTTQFPSGGSCQFGANWVLESPNDGTTEIMYAQLDGGIAMGNTLKQCHVDDMNHPAQCRDHARNKILNQAAKL